MEAVILVLSQEEYVIVAVADLLLSPSLFIVHTRLALPGTYGRARLTSIVVFIDRKRSL